MLLSFGFITLEFTFAALPTNTTPVITLGLPPVGHALSGIPAVAGTSATGKNFSSELGGWFLYSGARRRGAV